ncbi:MAG: hypothetical protein ACLQU2_11110 [Candidatus Binataceae bacterium]
MSAESLQSTSGVRVSKAASNGDLKTEQILDCSGGLFRRHP